MSFAVEIIKLAKLTGKIYKEWTNHHSRRKEIAVNLMILRDVLDHVKTKTMDATIVPECWTEDYEDWVTVFQECSSTINELTKYLGQPPLIRRFIMGKASVAPRQVPDKLKYRLRQARSSTVAFLFAFGHESLRDVDRAFNDLEMYRRMRDALDKSEVFSCHRGSLHELRAQYGTEDRFVMIDTAESEGDCVIWRSAVEVLSGKGYTPTEIASMHAALEVYLRRKKFCRQKQTGLTD